MKGLKQAVFSDQNQLMDYSTVWVQDERQRCRKMADEKLAEFEDAINGHSKWLTAYFQQLMQPSTATVE